MHIWALGLSCEPPAALGPPGFHSTTEELQTCTFQAPAFKNTTKIPLEGHPERHKKSEMVVGERKNREILGTPPFRASPFGAPFFWVFKTPPFGASPFGAFFCAFFAPCCSVFFIKEKTEGQKTETPILTKVGLARVGQPNFGQSRSIKVGQNRSQFFGQSRIGQSRSNKDGHSRFGQSRSQPKRTCSPPPLSPLTLPPPRSFQLNIARRDVQLKGPLKLKGRCFGFWGSGV